jgi:hypothetical protein
MVAALSLLLMFLGKVSILGVLAAAVFEHLVGHIIVQFVRDCWSRPCTALLRATYG